LNCPWILKFQNFRKFNERRQALNILRFLVDQLIIIFFGKDFASLNREPSTLRTYDIHRNLKAYGVRPDVKIESVKSKGCP
jgi:hypothetical protein